MKKICFVFLLLFISLVSSAMAQQKTCELPPITGHYGVGTISLPMIDQKRPGVYADGTSSKYREFMTQIWYPADRGTIGEKSVYLDEQTAAYMAKISKDSGVDLDKNFRFLIKTHAVAHANAAAGGTRFPVLIFSPGWGTSYLLYQSILEDLASHGYIVIGVNSPNSAGITVFPDGHSHVTPDTEDETLKEKYHQQVVDDIAFVTNSLKELNANASLPLFMRIDFERVGCFGHSFGGAAAIATAIQNHRLMGAINFDGSLRGEAYKKAIAKPMMMVLSELHPDADTTISDFWNDLPKNSCKLRVKGTDHMSFSDYMLVTGFLLGKSGAEVPSPIDPVRAIQITRDSIRTFFETRFKCIDPKQMNKLKKYQEVDLAIK